MNNVTVTNEENECSKIGGASISTSNICFYIYILIVFIYNYAVGIGIRRSRARYTVLRVLKILKRIRFRE